MGATAGSFNIGGTTGNTIGSLDGSSSIVVIDTTTITNSWGVVGIFDFSFQTLDIISNNRIGTITINAAGPALALASEESAMPRQLGVNVHD